MKTEEPKITFRNLIYTIDRTVLRLKRVKKGEKFSDELKRQIIDIVNFTIDSHTENFSDALYNKGVFIEKESLEILHKNLIDLHITKGELENIATKVKNLNNKNITDINEIQSILIKISIPIWETSQQLTYE